MKNIKSLFLVVLSLILSVFLLVDNRINALDGSVIETGGAGYLISERVESNQLGYGIKQFTDLAQTIRDSNFYDQQVNVMEVPASSGVKIVSYANLSDHKWTKTTVRNFARRYEQENPGWRVVGAVNGDFFDINGVGNFRYQTNNALVTDGEYFKTRTGTAVGFTNDGSVNTLVGGTPQRSQYLKLAVYDADDNIIEEFNVEKINSLPDDNESAVYFGTYNNEFNYVPIDVPDAGYDHAFYVEAAEYALPNNTDDFYGRGVITSTVPQTVERGQFALLTNNQAVVAKLDVDVKIRVQFEFVGNFAGATSVTGYSGKFLVNSEYTSSTSVLNSRHPRTAVGVRADGTVVMAVVDGRQSDIGMEGVYGNELAAIMKKYNCVEAYNLDGGGSSTMVIRDGDDFKVMNSPSDGFERSDSNCLLIVTRDPDIAYEIENLTANSMTVSAEVKEAYCHRIDTIMVRVNNVTKPLVGGKAVFGNLQSGQEYLVEFYYKTSDGFTYKVENTAENVLMPKMEPFILVFHLEESDQEYIFTLQFYDFDNASNLATADVTVNGKAYQLTGGSITLDKNEVGPLTELILTYTVNLFGDEDEVIVLYNPQYQSTRTLNVIMAATADKVAAIYR